MNGSYFLPGICGSYRVLFDCRAVLQVVDINDTSFLQQNDTAMQPLIWPLSKQLNSSCEETVAVVLRYQQHLAKVLLAAVEPIVTINSQDWLEIPFANKAIHQVFDGLYHDGVGYAYRVNLKHLEILCP